MHRTRPSRLDPKAQTTRRDFCLGAASTALLLRSPLLRAQTPASGNPSRPDVAAIDHDRILAAAKLALSQQPTPITSLLPPHPIGSPHDFYSETPGNSGAAGADPTHPPFTAHTEAIAALGRNIAALAAACHLTREEAYAAHAATHLRAWFVTPATRMTPNLDLGQVLPPPAALRPTITTQAAPGNAPGPRTYGTFEGVIETLPLVDVAQAIPFLAASAALTDADLAGLNAWFSAYLLWLTEPQDSGPRLAALARDQKNHHGSSWLLQAAAYARLTAADGPGGESKLIADLRHRYKTVTIRAQMASNGTFPQELTSADPFRNSLFNLDLLALACDRLTTRFDNVWEFALQDGPGMRSAIAYHFPFMLDRGTWPYRADHEGFSELPGRRISLLLTARAYSRPEYAALWKSLPPGSTVPEVRATVPASQPLLWASPPRRRAL